MRMGKYAWGSVIWLLSVLCLVASMGPVQAEQIAILSDDTFDSFVEKMPPKQLLLVDFYAPWCSACNKLHPVLEIISRYEGEQFKLAKVDCTTNKRLCTVFAVRRYPDLRFVRDGHWTVYEGGRTLEALEEFRRRMLRDQWALATEWELNLRMARDDVVFIAGVKKGGEVPMGVLEAGELVQHLVTFAKVDASLDVFDSFGLSNTPLPLLAKIEQGREPVLYKGDMNEGMGREVAAWARKNNHPLISEMSVGTLKRLEACEKLLAMGIVDLSAHNVADFLVAVDTAATRLASKHSDSLLFGILDGVELRGFAEQFNVFGDLPRMVVLDISGNRYYEEVSYPANDAPSIEVFLEDVMAGLIPPKTDAGDLSRMMTLIMIKLRAAGWYSILLLIPLVGFLWACCTPDAPGNAGEKLRERLQRSQGDKPDVKESTKRD